MGPGRDKPATQFPRASSAHLKSGYKVAYVATSILMALASCRWIISAILGRAWFSQVAVEPWRQRDGWRMIDIPFPQGY